MDSVLTRIEALSGDAVALLQELVRTNSVNPAFADVRREDVIGGETRVNEILRERYEQADLETHWVAEDPERRDLVGVRKGKGGGHSLALNGHVDTVPPVDPENWVNGSPWNPDIRDGRLYGIGSTDMKGSDAAMWLVAQALHDEEVELRGDLFLHSVVGEETMQRITGRPIPEPSPQQPVAFGAASDASFYEAAGIPAVDFGPGDVSLAHCKDESVEIAEITAAARSLAAPVMDWCDVA